MRTDDWATRAEADLLATVLSLAEALGWTQSAVYLAGHKLGLSRAETDLLVPHGPADLAALYARDQDRRALASLADTDPKSLKMRQRIRIAVLARLDAAVSSPSATRRWAGYLALPSRLPQALRLLWASADSLWRWAGDTATDENHYSKRAILSGILISALAIRLQSGPEAAEAYLDRRIENVMAFETWKAKLRLPDLMAELATALARLRYR